MFFIIYFAFVQLGYLLFGIQVYDFRSFTDSVFTLFRMILGDFNFKAIESASTFLGPVYFLCYIFFVFFVLLNMFLAIINDTYADVKTEVKSRKADFQMGDFFKTGVNNVKGYLGIQDRYSKPVIKVTNCAYFVTLAEELMWRMLSRSLRQMMDL